MLFWGTRGIRQRKMRSALTVLGIIVGTAAVIALVSQTQGIQNSIIDQVNQLGPTTITVRSSSSKLLLTDAEVGTILDLPGVDTVIPIVTANVKIYGAGGTRSFAIIGVEQEKFGEFAPGYSIDSGRIFDALSVSEIVIGANVQNPQDSASAFISPNETVTIDLGGSRLKFLQAVGSLNTYGMSMLVAVDDSIFMSLEGAMNMLGRKSYSSLIVKATDTASVDSVVETLKIIYGTNVNINTVKQITTTVSSITGSLTILLGVIAAISLFVAGLGIMNIMFVSVIERTREIGVLKALGFTSYDVLAIFLAEALMLGMVGGLLGIASGTAISYVIPYVIMRAVSSSATTVGGSSSDEIAAFTYSPVIQPEIALLVFGFALAVSLLAGFYPARRASRMDPVEALRHE